MRERDIGMLVRIEITGGSIADALAAFGANLETADTETLVAELGHRLASEDPPRVLNIVPWAETETGKATMAVIAEAKAKRAATKTHSKRA